jgi:hypothetical protein
MPREAPRRHLPSLLTLLGCAWLSCLAHAREPERRIAVPITIDDLPWARLDGITPLRIRGRGIDA